MLGEEKPPIPTKIWKFLPEGLWLPAYASHLGDGAYQHCSKLNLAGS